jgi:hypothetical protein
MAEHKELTSDRIPTGIEPESPERQQSPSTPVGLGVDTIIERKANTHTTLNSPG